MMANKQVLTEFKQEYIPQVDRVLENNIQKASSVKLIVKAMEYSLMAGGKRLRPLLTLATLQTLKHPIDEAMVQASSAVELIHTYSLIHDDLPAMDNDDYRRGKLSNHKEFGAGIATLAGDGLLTLAFGWLTNTSLSDTKKIKLVHLLAHAAGPDGMVAGQTVDLSSDKKQLSLDELMHLHKQKTGELFHYCVMAGAIIADADEQSKKALSSFAWNFGLAFQIFDDIKDAPDDENQDDIDKNTYVNLLGMKGAKQKLKETMQASQHSLEELPEKFSPDLLSSFLSYFMVQK